MKKTVFLIFLLSVTTLLCANANAAIYTYTAAIDGAQEVPPTGSPGAGVGIFTFDDGTGDFTWDVNFFLDVFNPLNVVTAAHMHAAPPGANGAVFINLNSDGTVISSGVGSNFGSFEGSYNLPAIHFPTDAFVPDWYINIHSTSFPAGEIRGNLVLTSVVPLPASVWMFLAGAAFLTAVRRKQAA